MATGNVNTTTVDAFIPEIWSKKVILTAIDAAVFANLVTTEFDGEINNVGDTVHVPLFSAVTIGDKSTGAVTYTNYTESTVDILIDSHKYFAFRVEDIAKIQSSPDLVSGYASQGGRGIAKTMDTSLAALSLSLTNNVGVTITSGAYQDLTDATIRNAIQSLDDNLAPENDRYLVISPAQKNAMLGIDKFVNADKLGSDDAIRRGVFGKIYDVLVIVSTNLPDVTAIASVASSGGASEIVGVAAYKSCVMFQREAFALATQMSPRVQSAYDIDHLATSVVGDVIYGEGELVDGFAVQVRTTTEV